MIRLPARFARRRDDAPAPRRQRARFNIRARLALVGGGLGLCSLALIGRAIELQLIDDEFYRAQGNERILRELEVPANRGMITDRNGEPLAVSSPVESLWANPQELSKAPERLPELARALDVPVDALRDKVSQRADKEFLWLQRRMNPARAQRVLALDIPGVYGQREFRRFYPQGEAIAHVLGFTNIDDRGQEGLELAFDDWLRGKPGLKRVIRDRRGRIVENVDLLRPAEPGKDLVLSIDRRIQYLTYRELKEGLIRAGAASGSAVVLDIATGEILAMANLPSYNPNAVEGGPGDVRRNRAVTDLLEPGSTVKPLTVAAGLEAKVITTATRFDTGPGWIANGRYRTTDHRPLGVVDTTGAIRSSSNVAMAMIVRKLGDRQFHDFLRRFGYGERTHSGFPGEAAGLFPDVANWSGTTKQTLSYGYGLNATPLQIARAYAAIANEGRLLPPTFVKGQRGEARQVLDAETARTVLGMMQTVTEPGGTAVQAAIPGYHVAGKTGTARKASGGGYSRRYVSYFAGMVPVEHPRFAMVVAVNEPVGTYYGGVVAAPVFRNVMDGALRLMDVPPDDIDTWLAEQARQRNLQASVTAGPPARMPALPAPATGPKSTALRPVALDAAGDDGAPTPIDLGGMRR